MTRFSCLVQVATLCAFVCSACSSGGTSSPSSGGLESDAAATRDDGGTTLPPSTDSGSDAQASAAFALTLNQINIPVDQASVTVESTAENGARTTKLRARILEAEKYSWNPNKGAAYIELIDVQLESIPHPVGDIRCVRSPTDPQNTMIRVTTENDIPLKSTDASCTAQVATWEDGVAYRGSAKGFVTGASTLPFTFAWNVFKK